MLMLSVSLIDFHLQWWLSHTEKKKSHDPVLIHVIIKLHLWRLTQQIVHFFINVTSVSGAQSQ